VQAAHLDPLVTAEEDHADRARTPPADHHTVAALPVLCRVSAQQMVRIVVLTSDQALEARAVRHLAGINW
jgi:hypothetical protein